MVEKYGALPSRSVRCELLLVCWMECVVEFALLLFVLHSDNRMSSEKESARFFIFSLEYPGRLSEVQSSVMDNRKSIKQ